MRVKVRSKIDNDEQSGRKGGKEKEKATRVQRKDGKNNVGVSVKSK